MKMTDKELAARKIAQLLKDQEFADKQAELLKDIPEEFRGALSHMAWEEGHSYGYDEVLSHLREYVDSLKEPIQKFRERVRDEALDDASLDNALNAAGPDA